MMCFFVSFFFALVCGEEISEGKGEGEGFCLGEEKNKGGFV